MTKRKSDQPSDTPSELPPVETPVKPKLQNLILSCSTCKMQASFRGYADPSHGDGWPEHRCRGVFQGARRTFDQCREDQYSKSGFGAL